MFIELTNTQVLSVKKTALNISHHNNRVYPTRHFHAASTEHQAMVTSHTLLGRNSNFEVPSPATHCLKTIATHLNLFFFGIPPDPPATKTSVSTATNATTHFYTIATNATTQISSTSPLPTSTTPLYFNVCLDICEFEILL